MAKCSTTSERLERDKFIYVQVPKRIKIKRSLV